MVREGGKPSLWQGTIEISSCPSFRVDRRRILDSV